VRVGAVAEHGHRQGNADGEAERADHVDHSADRAGLPAGATLRARVDERGRFGSWAGRAADAAGGASSSVAGAQQR
jgi:hypothetical protein